MAALSEPTAVAVHATRLAAVGADQRVLILGAGAIGLLAVVAARAAGAADVWITARHPHQAAAARRLGATRVFATTADADDERRALARDHESTPSSRPSAASPIRSPTPCSASARAER